ncbi:hypothetical protein D3C74_309260 [compost metagenome]
MEVLRLAVGPGHVGVVLDHDVEEVLGRREVHRQLLLLLRGQQVVGLGVLREHRVPLERTDELGDRRVGVLARQDVLARRELSEERHLVERLGGVLDADVTREVEQLVERLVHAAVLGAQQHVGAR